MTEGIKVTSTFKEAVKVHVPVNLLQILLQNIIDKRFILQHFFINVRLPGSHRLKGIIAEQIRR